MTWLTEIADRRARAKKMLVVHKNRYWLAHRNGRVAAESGCEMPRANPYRKNGPSWRAFNEGNAIAIEARQRTDPEEGLDPKGESAGPQDIAQGPSQ